MQRYKNIACSAEVSTHLPPQTWPGEIIESKSINLYSKKKLRRRNYMSLCLFACGYKTTSLKAKIGPSIIYTVSREGGSTHWVLY